MRWLCLLLTCQVLSAAPLDERLSLRFEAGAAFSIDGYTRLRHFDLPGDRLAFRDELGVDNWFALTIEAAWHFDESHAITATFSLNRFRGENSLGRSVVHEGATFARGAQLRFGRTTWWFAEAWYCFTPWDAGYAALHLQAGVRTDFADVWVKARPGPTTGKRDDHENFGTLAMPLPTLGARFELRPVAGLQIAAEARGCYADNWPTWHGENGRTSHSQTALDARVEISYRAGPCEFGAALHHRMLYLEQSNEEDGNEFSASGLLVALTIRVRL